MVTCLCGKLANLKYKLKHDVYECSVCRLQLAAQVEFNMAFESDLDESNRFDALKSLRLANFEMIIDRMGALLPAGATGLEVGSGYGWFMEKAAQAGYACFGIEPEHAMWLYATNNGLNVAKGFFPQDLPESFDGFHFIIFNDVFEHISDMAAVLEKCFAVLRHGGLLIINVPVSAGAFYTTATSLYHMGIKAFANRMWQFDFHSPHFYYFNRDNMKVHVEKKGFRLEHYHRLETLHPDMIAERIAMDKKCLKYVRLLTPLLQLSHPVIKRLNEDVGCFYFRKPQ